jgi:hypothetical protein
MVLSSKMLYEMMPGGIRVREGRVPAFNAIGTDKQVEFVVRTLRDLGKALELPAPQKATSSAYHNIQSWLREGDTWARLLSRIENEGGNRSLQHILQGLQGCWNVVSSPYTRAR